VSIEILAYKVIAETLNEKPKLSHRLIKQYVRSPEDMSGSGSEPPDRLLFGLVSVELESQLSSTHLDPASCRSREVDEIKVSMLI
jgi:hypothetical protein